MTRTGARLAQICCGIAIFLCAQASGMGIAPAMRTVRRGGTSFRIPADWRELDSLAREIEQRFLRPGHGAPLLASAFGDRSAGLFVVLLEVVSRPEVQDASEAQAAFSEAFQSSMRSSGAKLVRFFGENGETHFVARAEGSVVHARTVVSVDNEGILHLFALQCVRARKQLSALDTVCHEVLASFAPTASAAQGSNDANFRLDGGKDAGPWRVPPNVDGSQPLPNEEEPDRLGLLLLAGGAILLFVAGGMYLLRRRDEN